MLLLRSYRGERTHIVKDNRDNCFKTFCGIQPQISEIFKGNQTQVTCKECLKLAGKS
jgi:hypothetical protein